MLLKTALQQIHPDPSLQLNLKEALVRADKDQLQHQTTAAARSFIHSEEMNNTPIIAITGELNSGKSSVIATFLSEAGRSRVPRGNDAKNGTHRFVYWLPKSWSKDDATKALLISLIAETHGGGREYLSDEPAEAALQYASGEEDFDKLSIPLIAWDSQLDDLGIGLLDCPDIQTLDDRGNADGSSPPDFDQNPRLDFLSEAARICSAFFMIWSNEQLRNKVAQQMIRAIRAKMPEAPLYLLVNKIEPDEGSPKSILDSKSLISLLEIGSISKSQVYGAYNFYMSGFDGGKGWKNYTPDFLVKRFDTSQKGLPQFFPLAEVSDSPPDLEGLAKAQRTADLQKTKLENHRQELTESLHSCYVGLRDWAETNNQDIEKKHKGLLQFCESLMKDGSGMAKQALTPQFLNALHESFVRTAPFHARIAFKMAKPFQVGAKKAVELSKVGIKTIKELMGYLKALASPGSHFKQQGKKGTEKVKDFFSSEPSIIIPEETAKKMHALRWCPVDAKVSDITDCWSSIFAHFNRHPVKSYDSSVLDTSTCEIWESFSGWQKFKIVSKAWIGTLTGLGAMIALFAAAVDGGATLLTVTVISSNLSGGILAIGGAAGAAVAGPALLSLEKNITDLDILPHLSRLFASACDVFGFPRQINNQQMHVNFYNQNKEEKSYDLPAPDGLPLAKPSKVDIFDASLWETSDELNELEETSSDTKSISEWIQL